MNDKKLPIIELASLFQKAIICVALKEKVDFQITYPDAQFGDYACNAAMILAKKLKKNPREIAEKIIKNIPKNALVDKVEIEGPGFMNVWLKESFLKKELKNILGKKENYGRNPEKTGKKIAIEHTSPNIIKLLHVGHIRNNVLGMAVGRLLKWSGTEVILDCINNDRGIHVCKAMWGYLAYGEKRIKDTKKVKLLSGGLDWKKVIKKWEKNRKAWLTPKDTGQKPDHFVDPFYILGVRSEDNAKNKTEMREMLQAWESQDPEVMALWKQMTDWVHEGFRQTYKRLGSHHDYNWHESKLYKGGKKIILEGVKKRIFQKLPDGAILTNLKKYDLADQILMRSDGTALYGTFDLNLTKKKCEKFQADRYIWVIGPEQNHYLKQLFAACEQLGFGNREQFFHLSYGFVYLKGKGKMSSRAGTVIGADELIDMMRCRAEEILKETGMAKNYSKKECKRIAEMVGMGALKYGILRYGRTTDMHFDIDEALSFEGESGPYLQYTYARGKSILRKKPKNLKNLWEISLKEEKERALVRELAKFPEVSRRAGEDYRPNVLANYLYELARIFNSFYHSLPVLKARNPKLTESRLNLVQASTIVLKNGLNLLGIEAPEKM